MQWKPKWSSLTGDKFKEVQILPLHTRMWHSQKICSAGLYTYVIYLYAYPVHLFKKSGFCFAELGSCQTLFNILMLIHVTEGPWRSLLLNIDHKLKWSSRYFGSFFQNESITLWKIYWQNTEAASWNELTDDGTAASQTFAVHWSVICNVTVGFRKFFEVDQDSLI